MASTLIGLFSALILSWLLYKAYTVDADKACERDRSEQRPGRAYPESTPETRQPIEMTGMLLSRLRHHNCITTGVQRGSGLRKAWFVANIRSLDIFTRLHRWLRSPPNSPEITPNGDGNSDQEQKKRSVARPGVRQGRQG